MNRELFAEILLFCLSNRIEKTAQNELDSMPVCDWYNFIQQLQVYDMAPLFYHRLVKSDRIIKVPLKIVKVLRNMYFQNAVKNVTFYIDFAEVLTELRSEGIDVVALKGAHLAGLVYDDLALRPMCDLDILVRIGDLSRAEKKLLEMGYGQEDSPTIEEQCAIHHHLIPFTKPNKPPIEVHWTICRPDSPFKININNIWERTKEERILDIPIRVLSNADLLLHLCLHVSYNHKFNIFDIKNICDISQTVRHYGDEIDWERLIFTVKEYNISRYIYSSLFLTQKMTGTEIPIDVLNALETDNIDAQILETIQNYILFIPDLEMAEDLRKMKEINGVAEKIKIMPRKLFPSIEYLRKKYELHNDSKLGYLYYLRHLSDIFTRAILLSVNLMLRTEKAKASLEAEKRKIVIEKWLHFDVENNSR